MYRISAVIVAACFLWVGLVNGEETVAASESARDRCVQQDVGQSYRTLVVCREALSQSPDDPQIGRMVAELEFQYGDPMRSAEVWAELITREGWQPELARGQAMAMWRAGDSEGAGPVLREIVDREPSASASMDLVGYLLAMDRNSEAVETAASAADLYPDLCEFEEIWGQALAADGDDSAAAGHFARSVKKGCPHYRWTRLGPVPTRLDRPPYKALLVPGELVSGLDDLDDDSCLRRFELLGRVMTPAVAPAVTDQVITRPAREIRLTGIGLLAVVGAQSLASWERLLASDDLLIRKQALRRIQQLDDPAFVPLLEEHLAIEALPGNRNLTALALGELLLRSEDPTRGLTLLEGIQKNDPAYPQGLLVLLGNAEERGAYSEAVVMVDRIRAAAPEVWIDPDREALIRQRAGVEVSSPDPVTPESAPGSGDTGS